MLSMMGWDVVRRSFIYLKSLRMKEVIPDTSAIAMMGTMPFSVIPGTSSSATRTTIRLITNEKSPRVMSRIGKATIRNSVPRNRFTSPRMTAKMRMEVYPFWISIPETYPDCATK